MKPEQLEMAAVSMANDIMQRVVSDYMESRRASGEARKNYITTFDTMLYAANWRINALQRASEPKKDAPQ